MAEVPKKNEEELMRLLSTERVGLSFGGKTVIQYLKDYGTDRSAVSASQRTNLRAALEG
jgi:uncharacterized alpha/beta hydrolase family protein